MPKTSEKIYSPNQEQELSIELISTSSGKKDTCVNGKIFSNFVVDIGGAPLVNALNQLIEPNTGVMIVDPVAPELGPELIQALLAKKYFVIPSILTRGPFCEEDFDLESWSKKTIAELYQKLGTSLNGQDWTERIFFSDKSIDKFEFPFADLVTCYYPIPLETSLMQPKYIIQSGMKLLKASGLMRVVTESMHWVRSAGNFFDDEGADYFSHQRSVLPFNPNVVPESPLSLCDVAYVHRPSIVFEIRHNNRV